MKRILNIILALLLLGSVLTLNSCKEKCPCTDETNPECDNYNPCWDQKPVTADFEMGRFKPGGWPDQVPDWIPETAFLRGGIIGFKALGYDESDTSIKYTWSLGLETITEHSFTRDFFDLKDTEENDIEVTLMVEGKPNLDCFPEDDGKDTIVKYIHFVEGVCEFLVIGDFKVLFEGYTDSVIVSTRAWNNIQHSEKPDVISDSCSSYRIIYIGFDPQRTYGDTNWRFQNEYQFNSKIYFTKAKARAKLGNGSLEVDPKSLKVEASYTFGLGNEESISYTFKGRKIK